MPDDSRSKSEPDPAGPEAAWAADSACVPGVTAVPGGWTERQVQIGPRTYRLTLPATPDALLDDPAVLAMNRRDDYMPYWAFLWPAAFRMAECILRRDWPDRAPALEIGCGLGLVGLAALDRGLDVTFSDYQQDAVDAALCNARRNGHGEAKGRTLDWRWPSGDRFPIILGSDLLYEIRNHAPILGLLERMLCVTGVAWLGDAGRQHAAPFVPLARACGFDVAIEDEQGRALSQARAGRFQLIILRRRFGASPD